MPIRVANKASELDKHNMDINTLLWHKEFLFSGGDDGYIMVWRSDLKKLGECKAHPNTVNSLAAIGDTLYSCSNDGMVKAWTMDLKEKATLANEDCEFWKLASFENKLYAGTDNGFVFQFENNMLKNKYDILAGVKDMAISENLIFSIMDTHLLVTEMLKGGKCIRRKNIPAIAPFCLVDDKIVLIGGAARDIAVHENSAKLQYEQVTQVKDAHKMIINGLVGAKRGGEMYLYSGGWDKVVKLWNLVGPYLEVASSCPANIIVNALAARDAGNVYAGGEEGHLVHVIFAN